jgi:cell division protein FtsI (penicillin-binding protein 3)
MVRTAEPVPGYDAVLTIDYELQEIANDALRLALAEESAQGGEILLVDPRTGDVLAAASRSADRNRSNWTAATVPYEPGSTIKAFTLSAVLGQGRGSLRDSIWAEDGRYPINGRVITDSHAHGWLTLREGFLVSSNIVMAKVASRLAPTEQYRYLRDFGFGSPTGVAYPAESGGRLSRPDRWSKQSQASLAMGYEISVTPLQLAMAYAAIANGGTLLEPRLIREVRSHDGRLVRSFPTRTVRRTIPMSIAREVRAVLTDAVESGTGQQPAARLLQCSVGAILK